MVLFSDNRYARPPCNLQPGLRNDEYRYDHTTKELSSNVLGPVKCEDGSTSEADDSLPNVFTLHRDGKMMEWLIDNEVFVFWKVSV